MKKGLVLLSLAFLFLACSKQTELSFSVFHWKSKYQLSQPEQEFLAQNSIKKVYLRYFDVAKVNGKLEAVSALQQFVKTEGVKYIPCVYITQKSLQNITDGQLNELAKNLIGKTEQINSRFGIEPKELLLDCDWTNSTQKAFFGLIELVERLRPEIRLISTVRLHQLKYFEKTGVPPAKKGVLMMYNMGDLTQIKEQNSIVNPAVAEQYKRNLSDYPIKLDIALPIFSWLVLYRDAKPREIISSFDEALLLNPRVFDAKPNGVFVLKTDTFLFNKRRYQYDAFRLEESSNQQVLEMMDLWKDAINSDSLEIILYDLRPQNITNRNELIEGLQNSFS